LESKTEMASIFSNDLDNTWRNRSSLLLTTERLLLTAAGTFTEIDRSAGARKSSAERGLDANRRLATRD